MSNYTVETIDRDLTTIRIEHDQDCLNPRKEWDNAGIMVCWHRNYDLGDKHSFSEPSDALKHFKETSAIFLPLYLYDHSGITMRTSAFSCQWDSGQVGYIYMTREQALKEFGGKHLTKTIREKVEKLLNAEVETYDDYLTGNCYGFIIEDKDGNHLDSCWGFLGNVDYCKQEALSNAEHYEEDLSVAFEI